jgi:hypothetical protein
VNWVVDHVARIVPDLEGYLKRSFLPEPGRIVYDPLQDAEICFIDQGPGQPRLELIAPKSPQSRTYAAGQAQPNALHHLGYRVKSVEAAQELMRTHRLIPVYGPVPAVAFGGTPVLFAYSRNRELLEFVCET